MRTQTNHANLHIASYNIHKGYCAKNRRFILDEMRQAIRDLDSDVLFLQEVVGHNLRYHSKPHDDQATQFEYLAEEIWPHHAYGKNAIYDHGHHGNAILSKHAFLHQENIDISQWQFSRRGVLMGKLDNGIYVLCAHFGLLGLERRFQMRELLKLIDNQIPPHLPLIIAGDFNDWQLKLDKKFKRSGFKEAHSECKIKPAKTFPAKMPLLSVDRIYFRNLDLLDAQVLNQAPWNKLSDHCAIKAHFSWSKH
jgi:endonuclease/exonuclease/phosphatase family metal-dependent hydrolase